MPELSELDRARRAKDKLRELLSRSGHVSGVGISRKDGHYVVKVLLESSFSKSNEVPKEVDDVPVVIQIVGDIRKQNA